MSRRIGMIFSRIGRRVKGGDEVMWQLIMMGCIFSCFMLFVWLIWLIYLIESNRNIRKKVTETIELKKIITLIIIHLFRLFFFQSYVEKFVFSLKIFYSTLDTYLAGISSQHLYFTKEIPILSNNKCVDVSNPNRSNFLL